MISGKERRNCMGSVWEERVDTAMQEQCAYEVQRVREDGWMDRC